jgi:hypothetical protein
MTLFTTNSYSSFGRSAIGDGQRLEAAEPGAHRRPEPGRRRGRHAEEYGKTKTRAQETAGSSATAADGEGAG